MHLIPILVPVSATATEPFAAFCEIESEGGIPATVGPPTVQGGMPPTRTHSASGRGFRPSQLYGDTRPRYFTMEHKMGRNSGRQRSRRLKGVRAKQFARMVSK